MGREDHLLPYLLIIWAMLAPAARAQDDADLAAADPPATRVALTAGLVRHRRTPHDVRSLTGQTGVAVGLDVFLRPSLGVSLRGAWLAPGTHPPAQPEGCDFVANLQSPQYRMASRIHGQGAAMLSWRPVRAGLRVQGAAPVPLALAFEVGAHLMAWTPLLLKTPNGCLYDGGFAGGDALSVGPAVGTWIQVGLTQVVGIRLGTQVLGHFSSRPHFSWTEPTESARRLHAEILPSLLLTVRFPHPRG